MEDESIKLFFSYSHKDEALRNELVNHLHILTRQGVISSWHDRKILPGDEWHHHIHEHLETADLILLLLSADFIASDYCLDTEVEVALRRHESGEACVVPIVLRPVDWTGARFAKLQALPTHGKPITMWADRDEAFLDVAQGIRKLAEHLRARRRQKFEEKQRISAQYKQKVEEILSSSSGCISVIARDTLNELCEKLKLTTEEAQDIEARAFEPYKIYEANLEKYKHSLLKVIDQYPFSEEIKRELEYRQRDLGIKSEDVERIEQPLLAAVKAESAKKLSRDQQEFSNTVQAHDPLDQDVRHGRQSLQRSLGRNDDRAQLAEKVVHPRGANQRSTPLVRPLDAQAEQQPCVSVSTDSHPNRSPRVSLRQKTSLLAGGSTAVVFAGVLTFFLLARTPQHPQQKETQLSQNSSVSEGTGSLVPSPMTASDVNSRGNTQLDKQDNQGPHADYPQASPSKTSVTRGWLGVAIQAISPDLVKALNLEDTQGALVADVVSDGPAGKAGLRRGDIIIGFQSHKVQDSTALPPMVAAIAPGTKVQVEVVRSGKKMTIPVTLGTLPEEKEAAAKLQPSEVEESVGLRVEAMTPELARNLRLDNTKGVVVSRVAPDSPAAEAGIQQGDIVREVNRQPVTDLKSYAGVILHLTPNTPALFLLERRGNSLYIALKPTKGG